MQDREGEAHERGMPMSATLEHRLYRVRLSISDPWEFQSAVGDTLDALLLSRRHDDDGATWWLLRLLEPVEYRGRTIELVVAGARHEGQALDDVLDGVPVSASLASVESHAQFENTATSPFSTGLSFLANIFLLP